MPMCFHVFMSNYGFHRVFRMSVIKKICKVTLILVFSKAILNNAIFLVEYILQYILRIIYSNFDVHNIFVQRGIFFKNFSVELHKSTFIINSSSMMKEYMAQNQAKTYKISLISLYNSFVAQNLNTWKTYKLYKESINCSYHSGCSRNNFSLEETLSTLLKILKHWQRKQKRDKFSVMINSI